MRTRRARARTRAPSFLAIRASSLRRTPGHKAPLVWPYFPRARCWLSAILEAAKSSSEGLSHEEVLRLDFGQFGRKVSIR